MIERTYSVLIDSVEYKIELMEKGSTIRVTDTETNTTETISVNEIEASLYSASVTANRYLFGADTDGDQINIHLDGHVIEVDVEEQRFREQERVSKRTAAKGERTPVLASIPGQVLEVIVEEGDDVQTGDTLLLLSAMKLENEIQSDRDGTIKEIHVEQGDTVEKEQALMEIEV